MEAEKSITVQKLEIRFLPILKQMAKEISYEFPHIKTNILSFSVGSSTALQGHDIGIECILPEVLPHQSNVVMLIIEALHLTSSPKLSAVDVCWDNGCVEGELFSTTIEITEDVLEKIEIRLPRMFNVLKNAIKRGCPSRS